MDENVKGESKGLERRDNAGIEEFRGQYHSQSRKEKGVDEDLVEADTLFGFFELSKSISRPLKFGIGLCVVGWAFVQGYVGLLRNARSVIATELVATNKDVESLKELRKEDQEKINKLQGDVDKLIKFLLENR